MKTSSRFSPWRALAGNARGAWRTLLCAVFCLQAVSAPAVLFMEDAVIGPGDTTYDGQDLIIWRCTVTVDGPHTFANVLVADGGVLTHSPAASGWITNQVIVAGERVLLPGTNLIALAHSNVLAATVRVTNPDQTVVYEIGRDYRLAEPGTNRIGL